jgi:hypothetical protein
MQQLPKEGLVHQNPKLLPSFLLIVLAKKPSQSAVQRFPRVLPAPTFERPITMQCVFTLQTSQRLGIRFDTILCDFERKHIIC